MVSSLYELAHDMVNEIAGLGMQPEMVEYAPRWADEYRDRVEQFHVEAIGCEEGCGHTSDCGTHSAPAQPATACDCVGVVQ